MFFSQVLFLFSISISCITPYDLKPKTWSFLVVHFHTSSQQVFIETQSPEILSRFVCVSTSTAATLVLATIIYCLQLCSTLGLPSWCTKLLYLSQMDLFPGFSNMVGLLRPPRAFVFAVLSTGTFLQPCNQLKCYVFKEAFLWYCLKLSWEPWWSRVSTWYFAVNPLVWELRSTSCMVRDK